jgi:hypothetical protein
MARARSYRGEKEHMYGEADKAVTWEDAEGERKCLRLKVRVEWRRQRGWRAR